MKKPFKVLSASTLATVFATTALIPVASAEVTQESPASLVEEVVYETTDGKLAYISMSAYMKGYDVIKNSPPQYIKGDNGAYYELSAYMKAYQNDMGKTLEVLHDKNRAVTLDKVYEGEIKDLYVVAKEDEQPEDRLNETFFYNAA